jgi:TolA-binding protein
VLVYAELGDIEAARRYFESLGEKEHYFTLLERLAFQFADAGKYGDASELYQRLMTEAPLSPRLPKYFTKAAEMHEKQGQRALLVKTLQSATVTLADDSAWMKKNGRDAAAQAGRDELLGKETLLWAQRFHQEAQKTKKDLTYDEALAVYGIYLSRNGELPASYDAHFYRAEIHVLRGKMAEAADGSLKAADRDEKHKLSGKHPRAALQNAIIALDNLLSKAQQPKLPEAGKVPSPIPLPPIHAKLVKALDTYVRMFPEDKDALPFAHRASRIVYAFGDYASANKRWTALVTKHPKSTEAYEGARLIVKVPVDSQNWPIAVRECRKFLAIAGVQDTKLSEALIKVLKGSLFQQALVLEKAEKRSEASEVFLAYHKEFPADADAPKALFNAANNKFRLGHMDQAIAHLQTLIVEFPRHELAPNVLYLIANSYDALGRFEESAKSFEQLAQDFPKLEAAPESLLRAAVQRNAIGDAARAQQDASAFIAQYPNHKDAGLAHVQLGKAYVRLGKRDAAHKSMAQGAKSLPKERAPMAVLLYGLAARAAYQENDAKAVADSLQAGTVLHKSLGDKARDPSALEGARHMGETMLALADAQLANAYKKQITDGLKLTEQFTKIRDDIQAVAGRYTAILQLGNAESGIGALYRMAEMQEFLAGSLLKAPAPVGAKPEEIEQFRSTLEGIALPLQEEAINMYVKAWEKANETEAITPFTAKIHEKLSVLRPGQYSRTIGENPSPSYYASEIVMIPETRELFED